LKSRKWLEELESIYVELSENPELYSSSGALNSHGRTLALRFGQIAAANGLLRNGHAILGKGDYDKCVKGMGAVLKKNAHQ